MQTTTIFTIIFILLSKFFDNLENGQKQLYEPGKGVLATDGHDHNIKPSLRHNSCSLDDSRLNKKMFLKEGNRLVLFLCVEGFAWISFVFLQPKHARFNNQSSRRVLQKRNKKNAGLSERKYSCGKA